MSLKRILRPSNTRIRLGVGLVLAALFCIQCTRSDAGRDPSLVQAAEQLASRDASNRIRQLEKLAAEDHVALLRLALENYRDFCHDYTCTFIKQERINGTLRPAEWVDVKFMEQPFSVAMAWVKNAPIGDRALYVEGKYDGMMLVRPKGLLRLVGTVTRKPDGPDVMANTLRPITLFGFRRVMESLLEVYELAGRRGECSIRFAGYKDVAGRRALALERTIPFRKDYPAKLTVWYLDLENLVPLGLEGYDWDDELICSYLYTDVKFNVGLAAKDFLPEAHGMKLDK